MFKLNRYGNKNLKLNIAAHVNRENYLNPYQLVKTVLNTRRRRVTEDCIQSKQQEDEQSLV